jgi:hypothetical protein
VRPAAVPTTCRAAAWSGRLRGVQRGQPQRFRKALERAHASAAISLELLALSGVGAVLRATGEPEQAATVLTFALGHEQLPPSYSIAARPALEALEAELPPEQLAAARLAAAATSLEDLVTRALEPSHGAPILHAS